MTKQFSVLEITNRPDNNELVVKVLVDQEEHTFIVKFEGLGATIPGKLQDLVMGHLECNKEFYNLLFTVHEGEKIEFPMNLKCWEYPPEQDSR